MAAGRAARRGCVFLGCVNPSFYRQRNLERKVGEPLLPARMQKEKRWGQAAAGVSEPLSLMLAQEEIRWGQVRAATREQARASA